MDRLIHFAEMIYTAYDRADSGYSGVYCSTDDNQSGRGASMQKTDHPSDGKIKRCNENCHESESNRQWQRS